MMMFQAKTLYFPDNTHPQVIADACLKAEWTWVNDPDKRVRTTNLCDKCGSCKHFEPYLINPAFGSCPLHPQKNDRSRAQPKCKYDYERKDDDR